MEAFLFGFYLALFKRRICSGEVANTAYLPPVYWILSRGAGTNPNCRGNFEKVPIPPYCCDALNPEWARAHLEPSESSQVCASLLEKLCSRFPKWSFKTRKPHTTGLSGSLSEGWQVLMRLRPSITAPKLANRHGGGFKGNEKLLFC